MASIDCTQSYLGNCFKLTALQQDLDIARSADRLMEIELTQSDQKKSRIYAQTTSGDAIGILKQRDWVLTDGDVFKAEGDRLLLIHLESQKLIALSFDSQYPVDALQLIHLGHTLGNHHYPIVVKEDKIYLQPAEDASTVESTIKAFDITGLSIEYETRSPVQALNFGFPDRQHSHE
jgi:urease accessory protein